MTLPAPDLAGFASAQQTLRQQFGRDVRFYAHAAMIYDPTIPASEFDDEGIPLDPLALASGVNVADVSIPDLTLLGTVRANVVFLPLQTSILRRDQTYETPLGTRSGLNKDLILDAADVPLASGASHFQVGTFKRDADGNILVPEQWTPDDDELWRVVNVKTDSFGSVPRGIVSGQGTQ